MKYEIVWRWQATRAASRYLKDDPDGLRRLFDTVDQLADDPRPPGTVTYGSQDLRRMRAGRFRVMYEVADSTVTVIVLHVGRTE